MAERAYSILVDKAKRKVIRWTGLQNGDTGAWLPWAGHYPDKTVHAYGTAGAGLSLKMEGSNEIGTPTAAVDLVDATEDVINIQTLPGVSVVLPNTNQIRPNIEGGDGTTAVTVLLELNA